MARWDQGLRYLLNIGALTIFGMLAGAFVECGEYSADSSDGFSPRDTTYMNENPDGWPQPVSSSALLPSVTSTPPWQEVARLLPLSTMTLQPKIPGARAQAESMTSATPYEKFSDGVDDVRDPEAVEDGQLHTLRELHVCLADKITSEPPICENPALAFVRSGGFSPRDTHHIDENPDDWPQPVSSSALLPSVTSTPPRQEVARLLPLPAMTPQSKIPGARAQAESMTSATPYEKFSNGVDDVRDPEAFPDGRIVADVRPLPGPAPDTGDMPNPSTPESPSVPETLSLDLVTIAEDFLANLPANEHWQYLRFNQAELRAALDVLALRLMNDSPTLEDGQLNMLREVYVYLADKITPEPPLSKNQGGVVATRDADATLHSDTSHGLPKHARTPVANILQAVLLCAIIFAVIAGGARFLKNRRRPVNPPPQEPPEQRQPDRRDATSSAVPTSPVQFQDATRSERTAMRLDGRRRRGNTGSQSEARAVSSSPIHSPEQGRRNRRGGTSSASPTLPGRPRTPLP